MLRRRYGTFHDDSSRMSLPATKMRPCSGRSSRLTRRRKVDLPDPDAPTRNTNSPLAISTSALRRAGTSPLYVLVTFSSLIMGRRESSGMQGDGGHSHGTNDPGADRGRWRRRPAPPATLRTGYEGYTGSSRRDEAATGARSPFRRSEEHTSELQSLMRHQYAL